MQTLTDVQKSRIRDTVYDFIANIPIRDETQFSSLIQWLKSDFFNEQTTLEGVGPFKEYLKLWQEINPELQEDFVKFSKETVKESVGLLSEFLPGGKKERDLQAYIASFPKKQKLKYLKDLFNEVLSEVLKDMDIPLDNEDQARQKRLFNGNQEYVKKFLKSADTRKVLADGVELKTFSRLSFEGASRLVNNLCNEGGLAFFKEGLLTPENLTSLEDDYLFKQYKAAINNSFINEQIKAGKLSKDFLRQLNIEGTVELTALLLDSNIKAIFPAGEATAEQIFKFYKCCEYNVEEINKLFAQPEFVQLVRDGWLKEISDSYQKTFKEQWAILSKYREDINAWLISKQDILRLDLFSEDLSFEAVLKHLIEMLKANSLLLKLLQRAVLKVVDLVDINNIVEKSQKLANVSPELLTIIAKNNLGRVIIDKLDTPQAQILFSLIENENVQKALEIGLLQAESLVETCAENASRENFIKAISDPKIFELLCTKKIDNKLIARQTSRSDSQSTQSKKREDNLVAIGAALNNPNLQQMLRLNLIASEEVIQLRNWSPEKLYDFALYCMLLKLKKDVSDSKWENCGQRLFGKGAPIGIEILKTQLKDLPAFNKLSEEYEGFSSEENKELISKIYNNIMKTLTEKQKPYRGWGKRNEETTKFYTGYNTQLKSFLPKGKTASLIEGSSNNDAKLTKKAIK